MSDEDDDKIINFDERKDTVIPTDEDKKKKEDKMRKAWERKMQNDRVLSLYKLGKFKNK